MLTFGTPKFKLNKVIIDDSNSAPNELWLSKDNKKIYVYLKIQDIKT